MYELQGREIVEISLISQDRPFWFEIFRISNVGRVLKYNFIFEIGYLSSKLYTKEYGIVYYKSNKYEQRNNFGSLRA